MVWYIGRKYKLNQKKSLSEIINNELNGKWCNGIFMVDLESNTINLKHVLGDFYRDKLEKGTDYKWINVHEKNFSRVFESTYKEAVMELCENKRNIIGPELKKDGVYYGSKLFENKEAGRIEVNCSQSFNSFNEILREGIIEEEEKQGKWLVY